MEKKYAKSCRGLIAYEKARLLAQAVFETTGSSPKEEMYSLTDQIRRSSRSVGANLAEAWAKRPYEKHFISKPTDSDGKQHETQHRVEVAEDCGHISKEKSVQMVEQCREVGGLIGSMIEKSSLLCNPTAHSIKEEQAEYFTD